jgi:hypothetical protein
LEVFVLLEQAAFYKSREDNDPVHTPLCHGVFVSLEEVTKYMRSVLVAREFKCLLKAALDGKVVPIRPTDPIRYEAQDHKLIYLPLIEASKLYEFKSYPLLEIMDAIYIDLGVVDEKEVKYPTGFMVAKHQLR